MSALHLINEIISTFNLHFCTINVVMKSLSDHQQIQRLSGIQAGVFSAADLRTMLVDRHSASFARRINRMLDGGKLRRFLRGWYVASEFDIEVLSQRLAPTSAVSFGNVLSSEVLIGTAPKNQVMAVKPGPTRTYKALGLEIRHLTIADHLHFGFETDLTTAVRATNAEKAVLDVLYFHQHGQRYFFDPFSDIDFSRLDAARLKRYLERYRNPKFGSFVRNTLELD